MAFTRRSALKTALASTVMGLGSSAWMSAGASAPVRIVSPFNPGGVNDVLARAISKPLGDLLKQTVVVENRPGAGGSIAATQVARSVPNGNTLFMGMVDTQSIIQYIYPTITFDPEADLTPVSLITNIPIVLMVSSGLKDVNTLEDLIKLAKSRPGALTFGSWGVGSIVHLAMERLIHATGMEMLHVPFSGQAPAVQAVLSNQVNMMFVPAGAADAAAKDGRIKILASATSERLELLPQVCTLKELGYDLTMGVWQALYAPARTPATQVQKLTAAVHTAMQSAGFHEVVRLQGAKPNPSSPESLRKMQQEERAIYGALVKRLGIRLDA
jgi:tripartite-type tricarboxylate transporter receptor subunit TctC